MTHANDKTIKKPLLQMRSGAKDSRTNFIKSV